MEDIDQPVSIYLVHLSSTGEVCFRTIYITFLYTCRTKTSLLAGQFLSQRNHFAQGRPGASSHVDRLSKKRSRIPVYALKQRSHVGLDYVGYVGEIPRLTAIPI